MIESLVEPESISGQVFAAAVAAAEVVVVGSRDRAVKNA